MTILENAKVKINVRDDAGEFYPVGRVLLRMSQGKAEHCDSFHMYPIGIVLSSKFYRYARLNMATLWSTASEFGGPTRFAGLDVTVDYDAEHDMVLV